MIAARVRDYQFVAVGDTIHYSRNWKFPSDFLSDYLKNVTGAEWGHQEIAKPFAERHPILQWYDSYCRFQAQHERRPDGTYVANAIGVVYCYLGLAYNLYLLKHNVELQERLVTRLKNREQFQGAYYELIVANFLIRAGFELTLEDETDPSSKHCEFSAISMRTGKKYWVEAKMRSVAGLLGKTGRDGSAASAKPTSKLSDHLRDALTKPAEDERLIFIDVNAPPMEHTPGSPEQPLVPQWAEASERQLDDREKNLEPGQQAYVFVTNMAFHRALEDEARGHSALVYGLGIPDFGKREPLRLSQIWRQKQKHIDAYDIVESIKSYPRIPSTFDGGLPFGSGRLKIGETYFFEEEGMIATVTTAMMSEKDQKIVIGLDTGHILSKDATEEELSDYKEHPDAYFGVVRKAGSRINDPYDLFEWMVDNYIKTPKERLLELCRQSEDYDALAKLDQPDLVLEICERWTVSAIGQQERA